MIVAETDIEFDNETYTIKIKQITSGLFKGQFVGYVYHQGEIYLDADQVFYDLDDAMSQTELDFHDYASDKYTS